MSSENQQNPLPTLPVKDRVQKVRNSVQKAAERSGRSIADICLVAVTKTIGPAPINEVIQTGIADLGENKIQEAEGKRPSLKQVSKPLVHHFLGSLQTNKARKAIQLFDLIQSVDRPKLATFLNRVAGEEGKKQQCLVEVKVSDEPTKSGVPYSEASEFIKIFKSYANLELKGLMTIAPFDRPEQETRACFAKMKKLFEEHRSSFVGQPILSMGMTDDYEMAVEEGSTMVRIGRALFGERNYGLKN